MFVGLVEEEVQFVTAVVVAASFAGAFRFAIQGGWVEFEVTQFSAAVIGIREWVAAASKWGVGNFIINSHFFSGDLEGTAALVIWGVGHIKIVGSAAFFVSSALVKSIDLRNIAPNVASSLAAYLWILTIWAFLLVAKAWAISRGVDTEACAFADVGCAAVTLGLAGAFEETEFFSITAFLTSVVRAVLKTFFAGAHLIDENSVWFKFTAFLFGGAVTFLLTVDLVVWDQGISANFASLVFIGGYASMGNGTPLFLGDITAIFNLGTFSVDWAI